MRIMLIASTIALAVGASACGSDDTQSAENIRMLAQHIEMDSKGQVSNVSCAQESKTVFECVGTQTTNQQPVNLRVTVDKDSYVVQPQQ
jgi:hypothetical protein